jgi:phage I-like protein
MKTLLILDKDFQHPDDGYYQVVPKGEFPVVVGEGPAARELVQVVDDQALQSICNRFAECAKDPSFGGVLVDYDHFALDPSQSSEAAGWIVGLQNREDGAYARIRWSDTGQAAVDGGRFRFCSPVFPTSSVQEIASNRVRPLELQSLALTNAPNMKTIRPLTNRADAATTPETGRKDSMNEIKKMLGLPETATDQEVASALSAKLDRLTSLESMAAEAQAEKDMEPYKDQIENCGEVKKALMANREAGLKLLSSLKKPAAPAALPNRRNAVNSYRNQGMAFEAAWNRARSEKPELFSESKDNE